MNYPINKIKFYNDKSKSMGRDLRIVIDKIDLVEHLEAATEKCPHPGQWRYKNEAMVYLESLEQSLKEPGEFPIIISAHCYSSEAILPEDIDMGLFQVSHEEDYIIWNVSPPGAGVYFETEKKLEFHFHKPQILREFASLSG